MRLDCKAAINRLLLAYIVLGPLTFMLSQGPIWWKDRDLRIREQAIQQVEIEAKEARAALRATIQALPFDHIVKYHSIKPVDPIVDYGSTMRFVSDSEVLGVVDEIPGGVYLTWYETILCDMKPHDDFVDYTFYKQIAVTGIRHNKAVPRKPLAQRDISRGWPANRKMPADYTGDPVPARYPEDQDADCILTSRMNMDFHEDLNVDTKSFMMRSGPVQVRDLSQ